MITTAQLAEISSKIKAYGMNESILSPLRQTYQNIHFTYCMDDDIGSYQPVLTETEFNLYLIDGREHCLRFTNDYDIATGVVIAEIVAD
jgi:Family of unknown function (DUF6129)